MTLVVVLPSWVRLYFGLSSRKRLWSLSYPFGDNFTLDHPPVGDFGYSSTHRQLGSLSFSLGDDFMLDYPPVGDFWSFVHPQVTLVIVLSSWGWLYIGPSFHRWVWSLSFLLRDDFTLDHWLVGNSGRPSTCRQLLVICPPIGDFGHWPSFLGMTLRWTVLS